MGSCSRKWNSARLGTCHQLLCTSHLPIPLCPMAFRHDAGYVPNKTSSNDQVQYLNSSPRTGSGSDGTPRDVVFETPRELTEEEIRAIEADFTPQPSRVRRSRMYFQQGQEQPLRRGGRSAQ